MFLSVVILSRFTTETHAMALYIGTDTPHTHLHHVTGRNLSEAGMEAARVNGPTYAHSTLRTQEFVTLLPAPAPTT